MLQFHQSAGPVALLRAGSEQLEGGGPALVFALLNISIIYMLVCLLLSWAGAWQGGLGRACVHVRYEWASRGRVLRRDNT